LLIRELMTSNDELNNCRGASSASNDTLNRQLFNQNNALSKRNDELIAGNVILKRQNNELVANVEQLSKRNMELSESVGVLKEHNGDLDSSRRRVDELVLITEVLHTRNNDSANEIAALRAQLEHERQLRKAMEARLNRLLYGQFDEGTAFNRSLAPLLLCCDRVPNVTVEEAVFGQKACPGLNCLVVRLRDGCSMDYIREQIKVNIDELRGLAAARRLLANSASQSLTFEHLLAIRMYTFGSEELKLYVAVNAPFYDPKRTAESLTNQLPFVRLLIRSLRALGRATKFETGVTVYRGASTENSPCLQQVYDDSINDTSSNNLQPGILLRFPSFTSTSTDHQHAKEKFGDDFVYEIRLNHQVMQFCDL
jgi:hypothetical protein